MKITIRTWMTGLTQTQANDRKRNMNNPAKEIINCRNIFCRVCFVMKNKTYNKKKIQYTCQHCAKNDMYK